MRDILRFLLSSADQARIDADSITVKDLPDRSLQLSFLLTDPHNGPPQIQPLFPGRLTFQADPDAKDVVFTEEAPATWHIRGKIMVKAQPSVLEPINNYASQLELLPNIVWYGPIHVTRDMLLTTVREGLARATINIRKTGGKVATIKPHQGEWEQYAIAGFLAGTYTPEARAGASADDCDYVRFPMPTVDMEPDGLVQLTITCGHVQQAQDANDKIFDADLAIPRTDPRHPRNGLLPARHVYRSLGPFLVGAEPGNQLADAVVQSWPAAPRYFPLRFTRTWTPIPNCSAYFPQQSVRITTQAGRVLADQSLPAHGLLYVSQAPDDPAPEPLIVTLELHGDMRWLDGATPDSWRKPGHDKPLTFALSSSSDRPPHIVMRRRMRDEMGVEPYYEPGGGRCSYMSLRRTVRALVNNRVAGGALNYRQIWTPKWVQSLIDSAWANNDVGARAAIVVNNRPLPTESPHSAIKLKPILRVLFPEPVPPESLNGKLDRAIIHDKGTVAYWIWQSNPKEFMPEDRKRNYPSVHIGRGGPGALVYLGLASGYRSDPSRQDGQTPTSYLNSVVDAMLTGLEPYAALQFWKTSARFEEIKARRPSEVNSSQDPRRNVGHSPIFLEYGGPTGEEGMTIVDQYGPDFYPVQTSDENRRLLRYGEVFEIGIAANWEE